MFILYGVRASKIKDGTLKGPQCKYCKSYNGFTTSTFARYLYIFWIPFLPLNKTVVTECTNCKKTLSGVMFSEEMKQELKQQRVKELSPRPLWHGCGCFGLLLLIILLLILMFSFRFFDKQKYKGDTDTYSWYSEKLKADKRKMSSFIDADSDTASFRIRECMNVKVSDNLYKDDFRYFTSIRQNKILVLMEVRDMKKVPPDERKKIVGLMEKCLKENIDKKITEYYICVEGKWNTLLVKTPTASDLDGQFANSDLLFPFYDSTVNKTDSVKKAVKANR
jgi:hypothetical protein